MGMEPSRDELGKLDIILLIVEFGTVGLLLPRDGCVHATVSHSWKRSWE
jgi:hypothetical protein